MNTEWEHKESQIFPSNREAAHCQEESINNNFICLKAANFDQTEFSTLPYHRSYSLSWNQEN